MFSNLDVVEILKLGGIGLAFLLALLSFFILRREQKTEQPRKPILLSMGFFMVFSLIMLVITVVSDKATAGAALKITFGNTALNLFEPSVKSQSDLSSNDYFIDSQLGIAFKKPSDKWTKVKAGRTMEELLRISGLTESVDEIRPQLSRNPYGQMLLDIDFFFFELPTEALPLVYTDSAGNDFINSIIEESRNETPYEKFRSFYPDSMANLMGEDSIHRVYDFMLENEMASLRRDLVGIDSLRITERFQLIAYDKSLLAPHVSNLTLPGFTNIFMQIFGVSMEKLVASENGILMGSSITMDNMKLDGKVQTVTINRWVYFTESDSHFFLAEINHCPQLQSNVSYWDELQEVLESLTLVKK
ncbi:MAG: hypothetical protein KDD36_13050 [Flavobacteriales bacterium]|nr:hypothetical protein [Flavobacteriales bacterium]